MLQLQYVLGQEFILLDTEYTTWEGAQERNWSGADEYKEIVQIGAVRVAAEKLIEVDHLCLYAKPVINPVLSDYFIRLTGITQEKVDREGYPYDWALRIFEMWVRGLPLYSWGLDLGVMEEHAKLVGVPFPFKADPRSDIRRVFEAYGIPASYYNSGTIPLAFGEKPPSRRHDALNDARSILQGLRALKRTVSL